MSASSTTESTSTQMVTTAEPPGLHRRLTVLPTRPGDRAGLAGRLARMLVRAGAAPSLTAGGAQGRAELDDASHDAARRRVERHERLSSELAARLRRARELQAATANRRDEAATRARRMSAHLEDCDALLERAGELTNAAEEARRALDARRADVEAASSKLVLVEEQREAAGQMIEDATRQLHDLQTSELDETTLRRELEAARDALHDAEEAHAEANDALRLLDQDRASRAGVREALLYERAALVARIEAPLPDSWPVRDALAAFDAETRVGEPDLVARDLAREWIEVDDELDRIESALPDPPSPDEIAAAERRLDQIEQTIADLQAADRGGELAPDARDEIEAAHEAVLEAEEDADQSGGHDDDLARLHEAREREHSVLRRHGFDTYLDVILAGPQPGGDREAEMLDALHARRVAEDTVAALRASTEPPAIVTTLRARRDRIYREAADMLGCEPAEHVAELLYAHPVVPSNRTRELAAVLDALDIHPTGVAVREAAVSWLIEQDREIAAREDDRRAVEAIDRDLAALDEEDHHAVEESRVGLERVSRAHADVGATLHRVRMLEDELSDRATQDERRLQRIAAAEQLRAQIAAVSEALERSEEEYSSSLGAAEAAVVAAEADVERATAALSDAVRRLRRISEALPPALRPRAGDDPLGELPRLRETLAAEVDRAELALAAATEDLDRVRREIDEVQQELDDHLAVVPTDDVTGEDRCTALFELLGSGEVPAVLDDPISAYPDERDELLEQLTLASERRPVVLLTDDPEILGWAISLPDHVGAVTRIATDVEAVNVEAGSVEAPDTAAHHDAISAPDPVS